MKQSTTSNANMEQILQASVFSAMRSSAKTQFEQACVIVEERVANSMGHMMFISMFMLSMYASSQHGKILLVTACIWVVQYLARYKIIFDIFILLGPIFILIIQHDYLTPLRACLSKMQH